MLVGFRVWSNHLFSLVQAKDPSLMLWLLLYLVVGYVSLLTLFCFLNWRVSSLRHQTPTEDESD